MAVTTREKGHEAVEVAQMRCAVACLPVPVAVPCRAARVKVASLPDATHACRFVGADASGNACHGDPTEGRTWRVE